MHSRYLPPPFFALLQIAFLLFFGCSTAQKQGTHSPSAKTTTLASGLSMEYLEVGTPGGKPIIFLHGYTDSHDSFSRIAPLLPVAYHAYYITMRGHGNSGRPGAYAMELFASDVWEFMEKMGIESAVIVGHSMGSLIAQKVALTYPQHVNGLVLIGSAASCHNNKVLAELKSYVDSLSDPIDRDFVFDFQASTVAAPVPSLFMEHIVDESMKLNADAWKKILAALVSVDHKGDLKHIEIPVLVLWGEKDGVFNADDQIYLGTHLPNATLKLYPETGHGLQWERPKRFVSDLTAFMEVSIQMDPLN